MIKNRIFKRFATLLMAVAMLVTCFITPAMAVEVETTTLEGVMGVVSYGEMEYPVQPCSSYTTSGSFKVSLASPTRYFDGNDFHLQISTHNSDGDVGALPKVYFVTLYRKKGIGYQVAGNKVELNRHRDVTVTWAGVGPGEYYVFYSKANDGTTQYLDYVRMYN